MNTKNIGDLGEYIGLVELLKHGITISKPIGDNSRYDLILDVDGELFTCQVKSKTTGDLEKVDFHLNSVSNTDGSRIRYDVDCFMLVDITNMKVFILVNDFVRTSIILRYKIPLNSRNNSKMNMAEDYTIQKFLDSI